MTTLREIKSELRWFHNEVHESLRTKAQMQAKIVEIIHMIDEYELAEDGDEEV